MTAGSRERTPVRSLRRTPPFPSRPSARPARPPRRADDEVGGSFAVDRRRIWVPVVNVAAVVVAGAMHSWVRQLRMAVPAIATLWLLLTAAGLFTAGGIAVQTAAGSEIATAATVRVYLKDGATQEEVDALSANLSKRPDVRSVAYISKEKALEEARSRPGLTELAGLADANPFPASLEVQVDSLGHVEAVVGLAAGDGAADPVRPTSYDPDVYTRLRRAIFVGWVVAGGAILLLMIVGLLVVSSAMRAVVIARRAELDSMNLVGAPPWLLRGRITFEGLLSGMLAGALAALVLVGLYDAAGAIDARMLAYALPGVTQAVASTIEFGVLATGAAIAVITSSAAFRRSLR